jgi:WD40 repeat protein
MNPDAYDLFISYSRQSDEQLAKLLQGQLQQFAKPVFRRRALHVFRDDSSLAANPALWSSIEGALDRSEHLLVLASPTAAASDWVHREVTHWRTTKPEGKVLLAVSAGQVVWDERSREFDFSRSTAIPPSLKGAFREEPRYVDLRWATEPTGLDRKDPRIIDAVADLAAPLHDRPKDELVGEDLRQHRRLVRLTRAAVAILVVLVVAASAAAVVAVGQRNEASRQRDEANRQRDEATRQRAEADAQRNKAEEEARIALSRQLAADADSQMSLGLDRALLLAVQAYRTSPTLQARSTLLAAVEFSPRALRFVDAGPGEVRAVSFGRGHEFAAIDGAGVLRRLSADTGEQVGTPVQVIRHPVFPRIAFSSDGRVVATENCFAADDATPCEVHLWDVAAGTELGDPIQVPGDVVDALALSPNGQLLALVERALDDSAIHLWDIGAGQWLGNPMRTEARTLAFSPDGRVLASGLGIDTTDLSAVSLWDVATQQLLVETPLTDDGGVYAIDFAPDGSAIAAGYGGGKVAELNASDLTPLGDVLRAPVGVSDVTFNFDGTSLATVSYEDDHVLLWNRDDPVPQELAGHVGEINQVDFSADGTRLVSGGADGRLIVWATGAEHALARADHQVHPEWAYVSAMAFDGDTVVSADGSQRSKIVRWNPVAQQSGEPTVAPDGVVALSADGRVAATGDDHGIITLVDTVTGEEVGRMIAAHGGAISQLSFSGDGRTLASIDCVKFDPKVAACVEKELSAWDLGTSRRIAGGPVDNAEGLALSPDGRTAAVSTGELGATRASTGEGFLTSEVLLWDIDSNRLLSDPLDIGHPTGGLAWSPDSRLLAVAGRFGGDPVGAPSATLQNQNDVVIWDVATQTPIGEPLLGHGSAVVAAAFSPDGSMLASGDIGGEIRLWDVATLSPLGGRIDTRSQVNQLRFSPDGTALASAHLNGAVWLWEMTPVSWIRGLCALANRNLSEREWADYVGSEIPYETTCP